MKRTSNVSVVRKKVGREVKITTTYKGEVLQGFSDVFERITNDADAREYMRQYRLACDKPEIADSNVGYMTGYYSAKTAAVLRKRFGVSHPIFGNSQPSASDAMMAGVKMAKGIGKR